VKEKDNIPGTTVELLMILPHYFQILTLYAIVTYLFPSFRVDLTKFQVFAIAIGFQIIYHFIIYNKHRWMNYIEEFKSESDEQRKRGTNLIILYTVGTYVLFFGCLIAFFW
jgi:uncharacterized membrane protein